MLFRAEDFFSSAKDANVAVEKSRIFVLACVCAYLWKLNTTQHCWYLCFVTIWPCTVGHFRDSQEYFNVGLKRPARLECSKGVVTVDRKPALSFTQEQLCFHGTSTLLKVSA